MYATMRNTGVTLVIVALFTLRAWLLLALASDCVKVRLPKSLPHVLIAMKSAVSFSTDLTLAGHHIWKGQARKMTDVLDFSIRVQKGVGLR